MGPICCDTLKNALVECRRGFVAVILFSLTINVLVLAVPFYMLQVYDRVIVSRSTDTLVYLTVIAVTALLAMAILEGTRSSIMVRLSTWLDYRLSSEVLGASISGVIRRTGERSIQGLRDLNTVRSFVTGPGVFPILDAPWTPIFLAAIFLLHPLLGLLALAGAAILFSLAVWNEAGTRKSLQRSGEGSRKALYNAETAVRNANVIEAMGMRANIINRWQKANSEIRAFQTSASSIGGGITACSKFARQVIQIAVLGFGAWLVLRGEFTVGAMTAATILMSRALAPVEQAIGTWKSGMAARSAYNRVKMQLAEAPNREAAISLPSPEGHLRVENVAFHYPDRSVPTLHNINFQLTPGEILGLIGSTAAGKSTLASLLVGILTPRIGHIRLDGADMALWAPEERGRHVGYLPQDIELFPGTVAENIARMGEPESNMVIEAAKLAGVHDMILSLPKGYETELGYDGDAISGGQRQRIALARAVFGSPRFVVLDEPNASLDAAGEHALLRAITALKERRATVVIIAHRPSILRHVDKVLVLKGGMVETFGDRDEVLGQLTQPSSVVSEMAS